MADNSLWQLAIRAQEKDIAAIEEIYNKTVRDNYILIKTVLGRDSEVCEVLVQAYTDIFLNISSLDNPKDCKNHLNKATAKALGDYLVHQKKVQFSSPSKADKKGVSLEEEKASFNTFVSPYSIEADDIFEEIVGILNQFPSSQRFFMLLYFLFDMEPDTISAVTGASVEVIKNNILAMVKKLKENVAKLEEDISEIKELAPTPFIVWAIKDGSSTLSKDFDFSVIYQHICEKLRENNYFDLLFDKNIPLSNPEVSETDKVEESEDESLKDMGVIAEKVPFAQKSRFVKFLIISAASIPVLCVLFYIGLVVRSYINISRNYVEPTRIYTLDHSGEEETDRKTVITKPRTTAKPTTTTAAPVTLTHIVIGSPTTTSYKIGQALKFTLVGQYSNGTVKKIPSGYSVIGNTSAAGSQTIIVTYEGLSTSFTISVQRSVSKIEIASKATKVTYYVGDVLDTSGLKIKITYNDKTTEVITSGFSCSPTVLNTAGKQKITVSYSSLLVSYNVTVHPNPTSEPTTAKPSTTNPTTTKPTTTETPTTATNPPEPTTPPTTRKRINIDI